MRRCPIWLGHLVATLLPDAPEALGLLALMLHAHARRDAQRDAQGGYVPLAEQDPAQRDAALIDHAEALLRRASRLGATGRYQLEAAIQSAQVIRRGTGSADWPAIARRYDALLALSGSKVVAIDRAVAIAETRGAAEGLAARAGLLARIGDAPAADAAYTCAIGLEAEPAARRFLQARHEARVRSRARFGAG